MWHLTMSWPCCTSAMHASHVAQHVSACVYPPPHLDGLSPSLPCRISRLPGLVDPLAALLEHVVKHAVDAFRRPGEDALARQMVGMVLGEGGRDRPERFLRCMRPPPDTHSHVVRSLRSRRGAIFPCTASL